jgi:hypothetical protein
VVQFRHAGLDSPNSLWDIGAALRDGKRSLDQQFLEWGVFLDNRV